MTNKQEVDLQWQQWAKQFGYDSEREMWIKEYERHVSLTKLAKAFNLSVHTTYTRMLYNGVERKPRGGKRTQKFVMDKKLLQRVLDQGMRVVAKSLNVTPNAVYRAKRKFLSENPEYAAELRRAEEAAAAAKSAVSQQQQNSAPDSDPSSDQAQQGYTPPCQTENFRDEFGSRKSVARLEEGEEDV